MEIVEYLDGLNNKFDATIKKLTEEVAVLEEYKNKIIADIVTGKSMSVVSRFPSTNLWMKITIM